MQNRRARWKIKIVDFDLTSPLSCLWSSWSGSEGEALSHFLELYGTAFVAAMWFSIVLSLLLIQFYKISRVLIALRYFTFLNFRIFVWLDSV